MKKAYIQPMTSEFRFETVSIMAASFNRVSGADDLGFGGGTDEGGIFTGNSRRGSFWDDEE